MRTSWLPAGVGVLLACTGFTGAASAQGLLTATGPVRVSDTASWLHYVVGDREPGVVPDTGTGEVFISWIHNATLSERDRASVLQHARITVGASPLLSARGTQSVPAMATVALAVTRDVLGPIQVLGG
ncbi:MAG: hypothetical protein WCJ30_18710, partial [Deltaproteobacteria bacterium]